MRENTVLIYQSSVCAWHELSAYHSLKIHGLFTHLCLPYMLISLPVISTLPSIIYDVHPDKLIFHLQNLAQLLSKGNLLWPYSRIHHSLPLQDLYTFIHLDHGLHFMLFIGLYVSLLGYEFLKCRNSFFISTVTGIMSDTEQGLNKHLLKRKQKKLLNELAQEHQSMMPGLSRS